MRRLPTQGWPVRDRAVARGFLSYASQDAQAAQRIAEVLRARGIEVWFDQSELRGGELNRRRLDMALIAVLMPGQRTT